MTITNTDQDLILMSHLMRRAGFGATRKELEERLNVGYEATVDDLLDELKTLDKIDDLDRIAEIEELIEEVGRDNFEMGVAFIRENYWVQYCEDTAYDFGYLDRQDDSNPLHYHIDWQGWADAVAMDYNQTEFDGDSYYWRA